MGFKIYPREKLPFSGTPNIMSGAVLTGADSDIMSVSSSSGIITSIVITANGVNSIATVNVEIDGSTLGTTLQASTGSSGENDHVTLTPNFRFTSGFRLFGHSTVAAGNVRLTYVGEY